MKDFLSQAGKLLKEHKQYKRQLTVFLCLAVIVAFGTVTALKLYGQAMTHKVEVLECSYEVHEHTEECYERDEDGNLGTEPVCGLADYVIHVHNDLCYDSNGNLVCTLEEHEPHEHTEKCYTTEKVTVCGKEAAQETEEPIATPEPEATTEPVAETPVEQSETICGKEVHKHDDSCYEKTLSCGYEEHVHSDDCISHELDCEVAEHAHDAGCYDEEGNLVCDLEEHAHVIGCYDTEGNIICGQEHEHIVGCYKNSYKCGQEAHTHEEGCYTSALICEKEEHEHTEECYPESAAAPETTTAPAEPTETVPETEPTESETAERHVHTDACYEEVTTLTCGEQELHTHDDSCYDEECFDEDGNLIEGSRPSCGLLQLEEHVHTEECFKTVELTPEEVEALDNGAKLHIHTEECYDGEGNLICGHDATHIHMPECYDDAGQLICGYGAASHVHEDSCYDADGNLICGYETASHVHEDSCYDADGNLQCGYETASHVHEDSCYDADGNLVCGYLTASHVHDDSCYDADGNLQCGYETAKHEHDDSCYDAEGNLVCGYNEDGVALAELYCEESIHAHDDSCYDEEGNLICGKADFAVHTHAGDCYNVEGKLICPLPEIEAHVHTEECYPEGAEADAEPICGKEEVELHTHTDECYDAEGALICGKMEVLEHVHSEDCKVSNQPITKTFESESFIVTATYKPDANIPEAAELIVEQITEEGDEEHYKNRQAQYQEALGDEKATMRALMRIGFYVDGEEVEPESPVTITIQFLDENGLAEGKAITVIHFVEDGTELLEGSNVENGSTTFEMGSFSEIAVGYGVENVKVPVDAELKYETDEIEVIFHIEGEVSVPLDSESKEESEEDAILPDDSSEMGAEEETGEDNSEATETETENTDVPVEDAEGETATDSLEEDSEIAEGGVSVEIQNTNLEKKLEFRVDPLKEDSEEYIEASKLYSDGTEESIEENPDLLFLEVVSYGVVYDGKKLDLADCIVTAEVMPSEALVEYAETALTPMTLELDDQEPAPEANLTPEVTITVAGAGEDGTLEGFTVNEKARTTPPSFLLGKKGIAAFSATSQANPKFTVEFYAEIETLAVEGDDEASGKDHYTVIDTSKNADGTGGNLPKNGATLKTRDIYLNADKTVVMKKREVEVYSAESAEYILAPGLVYFNKIAKNGHYKLKEIRVRRSGQNDWETYTCENGRTWHFTNKLETQQQNPDEFILITEGATIRLMHIVDQKEVKNGADFYDYDVSDGNLYKSANANINNIQDRGNVKTHNSDKTWYMYTNRQGINSNRKDQTFGFGNSEGLMKTTMGSIEGNQFNQTNKLYFGPTFGLVTGLSDGKLIYNDKVKAPNLFNDGAAKGKTSYAGDLVFRQQGDTYTLIGAEVKEKGRVVSSKYNVDVFTRKLDSYSAKKPFVGNDFYPMDGVSSAGTQGHDLMFGAPDTSVLKNFSSSKDFLDAPASDDQQNHNHYFGMHYTIDFSLVKDYIGPLEYLFYGDDDMWVFLEKQTGEIVEGEKKKPVYGNTKLVCDIGGTHSAVGEYVNLWDYIKKGDVSAEGNYRLTFFYTERGASGSTCWMQFTLPSVSFATTEQDIGKLRIQKKVNGSTDDLTNEEFGFEIKFKDSKGNDLMDDFSYTKYYVNGTVKRNDVLIWNNSKFTLKAGEYIIIDFLPDGSTYTITEVGPVNVTDKNPGEDPEWTNAVNNPYTPAISGGSSKPGVGVVTGTIKKDNTVEIEYNNIQQYALPETGGTGTILYTIAGGMIVLFGAGFMYRKKFREGRGRSSL